MSLLAWIDFDEAERARVQRIMALGQERDSRDELGLGAIRDSISDHLFPGTSTIQTRLRYMLFVPWLFQNLEGKDVPVAQLAVEARNLEVRLGQALQAGGETTGVFGRDAGPRLQRLPSSVYWSGLGTWGIRSFTGSIDSLFEALRRRARWRAPSEGEERGEDMRLPPLWSPSLPKSPTGMLENTTFSLTTDEAQFIVDRLVATHPNSLLTWLARQEQAAECEYIWLHPHLADFPAQSKQLVRHAEVFSSVMHGASLLYNFALSKLREREDWVAGYRAQLATWAGEVDLEAVHGWRLEDFWSKILHPAHAISPIARRFVAEWRELVLAGPQWLAESPVAQQLVQRRETNLKKNQSRYTNRGVRDRWGGASGALRLRFRWNEAQSHLHDIIHAQ